MKRIWRTGALAALLCAALCAAAHAADPSYTGRIDPATGAALDVGEPLDGSQSGGRVYIGSGVYYDYDAHCFVYSLGDASGEVRSSAADGMVLCGTKVTVHSSQDAPVAVYKDGAEIEDTSVGEFGDVGEYTVATQAEGRSRQLLKFTIVGAATNAIKTFTVPDGFYVEEATRDEEDVSLDRYSVNMEAEGQYHIAYTCFDTGITYTLDTAIDRTPPEITLHGKFDEEMRTRSEVTFEGLQPGDTIRATNGGDPATPELNNDRTGGTFKDMGSYTMTVYDAAGNSSTYEFFILTYFNGTSLMFFALVLVCVVAVFLYVRHKRKNLKIG